MRNLVLVSLFFVFTASAFLVGCSKKDESISATTTVTYNGYTYKTVVIGTQTWFAENLQTEKYNDGTSPSYITEQTQWVTTTGAYCSYNNDASMKAIYGYLYNFHAVNSGKLCPLGWHVPSDNEWTQLIEYLGGTFPVAGGKMKTTTGWNTPNTGATNESGFSALAGGNRNYSDGKFYNVGYNGSFWSSTQGSAANAWSRYLDYNGADISRNYSHETYGFSVRCLRD